MKSAAGIGISLMTDEQNHRIAQTFERERSRLRNFIRKRIADESEVEDILQDVFYELVEAYRLMKPAGHAGAWLFTVARNRIIDFFRRKKPQPLADVVQVSNDGDVLKLEDVLPSADAGPEAAYARNVLLDALDAALEELPEEQREIFIANEFGGRSFRELAEERGISINTLLSRKRYAVQHLRRRLQSVYDDFAKR